MLVGIRPSLSWLVYVLVSFLNLNKGTLINLHNQSTYNYSMPYSSKLMFSLWRMT
ncbi:hypothetical protein GIB67_033724 [Kingdonia uniflora]|uniref:Uncharacterized protein n=1 Tax=Kingdonia uniflora TaxID=39325 RepID=A0A7J7P4I8_9MAGN|nr:hypothetical protein GIB67_033724 [Kingdonia uniflora]